MGPGTVTRVRAILGIALGLGSIAGCRDVRSPEPMRGSNRVTYSTDVAPIVRKYCISCHHPGGSAPFSMIRYEEVKEHAREIATVTQSRFMPPWLPEPGF